MASDPGVSRVHGADRATSAVSTALEQDGEGALIEIRSGLAGALSEGDSIAVNGVCLTATDVSGDGLSGAGDDRDARALLARRPARRRARQPRARAARGDRLGGHVVQGHVDGTGTVRRVRDQGFARVLEIDARSGLARYLVEKGSVAVDGVSLTVSALSERRLLGLADPRDARADEPRRRSARVSS